MTRVNARALIIAASLVVLCAVAAQAQPPAPTPTTAVLVNLTIKPEADRAQVMKTLPEEVRETVKLYLDGNIQQWFSRSDGRGVIFIVNASDAAGAETIMGGLPLAKSGLVNLEYTAVGPLSPLRALLTPSPGEPKQDH
jgi:hypothetical protein